MSKALDIAIQKFADCSRQLQEESISDLERRLRAEFDARIAARIAESLAGVAHRRTYND